MDVGQLAVGQLAHLLEQQQLSIDTPLRSLLPAGAYQNPWQRTHPVRLAHLLELTAGFTDLSALEFNFNDIGFPDYPKYGFSTGAINVNPLRRTP